MRVRVGPGPTAAVEDAANLRELGVAAPGLGPAEVAAALEAAGLGAVDGGHAWLSVAALRAAGPDDGDWRNGFEGMLEFARGRGWLSDDGARVRAHIES